MAAGVINEPGGLVPISAVPKLQSAIKMAETYAKTSPNMRNGTTTPPVRFAKVTTAWTSGKTVTVEMVRTDDFTTSVDAGRTFTIYVSFFSTPTGLETMFALNAIVPFLPFNGPDDAGVYGVAVSEFFGGANAAGTRDRIESIDTSTADQITFNQKAETYDFDVGLLQSLSDATDYGFIMTALKWIGIEVGGQLVHNNSPVDSTSHADHWFYVTFTITGGISIDGAGAVNTITLYFDRTGHLWKYDSTTQPNPATNYRYRHCSDPVTYPDLIFASQQANVVIEVAGECYLEESATTDADVTSPTPTVNATYATCAACVSGGTNFQWRKCPDDSTAAVLSPGHTSDDFAWLCISGALVRCYEDGATAATATDPTVQEQPGTTPASCAALVGWEMQDAWDGSGEASSTTSGDYYLARWKELNVPSKGTVAISGSKLVLASTVTGNSEHGLTSRYSVAHTGDFELVLDWIIDSWFSTSSTYIYQPLWYVDTGSGSYSMYRAYNGASNLGTCFVGPAWSGGCSTTGVLSNDTGKWRIRRVGTTVYGDYWNGSSWTNFKSGTDSATLGLTAIRVHTEGSFTGTLQCSINSMTAVDGSSNPLITDPTGQSCT